MLIVKKKRSVARVATAALKYKRASAEWHNGADVELHLYARSLQRAARLLVEKLDWNEDFKTAWDVGPIVLLYRQTVVLCLKALVGEGCAFMPSPTDHITLYKTRSLRWLAQIVCQIIKTVRWESEFKCDGISNLSEFSALVAELEEMEPVSCAIHVDRVAATVIGYPMPTPMATTSRTRTRTRKKKKNTHKSGARIFSSRLIMILSGWKCSRYPSKGKTQTHIGGGGPQRGPAPPHLTMRSCTFAS